MAYNKYRNKKVIYDGLKFDSQREADRYCELKLLQRAGKIKNLACQVPFSLIPPQYGDVNGKRKLINAPAPMWPILRTMTSTTF